ncbi:MAG TPA: site-specific DNA-methyltransferase [bacterium]|nr:site-specific DNA-methyltransferase [Candidatus Omnitrophota bacterium]HOJ61141.1 site-specific DNA-methyltransferase [bacterium]HOL94874.1 site-specific DNA-methyltransferase [bacterium]HPP00529.1 site-specific DNA-methyltransferase [bacterium]HXK94310.1 site-specific DNA-methyltransferase [bacterium]
MTEIQDNAIYNMDCIQGMKLLPPGHVDLIITDPPFAIDFKARRTNYNRTQSRVMDGYNEIPAEEYLDFTRSWMREAYRVLSETGSAFIFSGWNNLKDILIAIDDVGFVTVNHIIWKYQFGVVCKRRFVTSHYHCLFVCKDDTKRKFFNSARFQKQDVSKTGKSLRYQDLEDVWVIKREYWHGDKKTPTKLPAAIINKILSYTSEEGDLVLDPFLGSGQTAVVSKQNKRRYIGFEIVPEYYQFARERLETDNYRLPSEDQAAKATAEVMLWD